ncbi:hypothetical protein [Modestobacter italicus]|uniref:hypothetical protein n=1 Tax=Modestobacter italicus (strain DSM 44449 / CECT 9708 / BC 501) TaxID=2732864 RepID=UPI001C982482|nr:hypothetical protein [Modestobacter italicus]
MAGNRQLVQRAAARETAVQVCLVLAMFVVVYLVQEVVYRATDWPRLWILLVLYSLGWAGVAAVNRARRR